MDYVRLQGHDRLLIECSYCFAFHLWQMFQCMSIESQKQTINITLYLIYIISALHHDPDGSGLWARLLIT